MFPLSASVGIATGSPDESAEQILRRADHAMYTAKAQGPGNVRVASIHDHIPGRELIRPIRAS
jgi:PleD family two-component response regulator